MENWELKKIFELKALINRMMLDLHPANADFVLPSNHMAGWIYKQGILKALYWAYSELLYSVKHEEFFMLSLQEFEREYNRVLEIHNS